MRRLSTRSGPSRASSKTASGEQRPSPALAMSSASLSGESPGGRPTIPPCAQRVLEASASLARVTTVTEAPPRAAASAAAQPATPVPRISTSVASVIELEVQRDVGRRYRMRQRPDGDRVRAGECKSAHAFERHASRSLDQGGLLLLPRQPAPFSNRLGSLVVDQDHIGPGF